MNRALVAVLSISALSAGSAILAAPQIRPGEMTKARVWIENRGRAEAIPTTIESMSVDAKPLRVEVIGTPAVALVPSTVVQARLARQAWEHRLLTIPAGQDRGRGPFEDRRRRLGSGWLSDDAARQHGGPAQASAALNAGGRTIGASDLHVRQSAVRVRN